MRATRDDVAREAGVSSATVSRVFNNNKSVDNNKRDLVIEIAKELGYVPNAIARSLRTNNTKQLVYMVNDISNPFYSEVAEGFQHEAFKRGYTVNLCIAEKITDELLESFINNRVEGILIGSMPKSLDLKKIKRLVDYDISIVANKALDIVSDKISVIDSDFDYGINMAIEHLCSLGHKNIGFLDSESKGTEYDVKYKSFVQSILNHNLPLNTDFVVFNEEKINGDFKLGGILARKLLERKVDVTALMCTNDYMALGANVAFQQAGLKIPEDISIIGYDNIIFCEATYPALTTINIPKFELGARAVELMLNQKEGITSVNEKLPTDLIIRGSTGVARKQLIN